MTQPPTGAPEGQIPNDPAASFQQQYAQPQYAPAGQQPHGQPQYGAYAPQPPQKQKHTFRNVMLALIAFGVLFIGGCVAIVAGTAGKVANDLEEADNAEGGAKNPMTITAGQAFEVNKFNYAAGWTITPDGLGGTTPKNLKVTNNRDQQDAAIVDIKFMKGTEILGSTSCTTEQILPKQTATLNCLGTTGPVTGYDRITINDTF